jgi:hypothetical protein
MKYFTLRFVTADLANRTTIYCFKGETKLWNDVIQSWGNTEEEAINDLFEAVAFELS